MSRFFELVTSYIRLSEVAAIGIGPGRVEALDDVPLLCQPWDQIFCCRPPRHRAIVDLIKSKRGPRPIGPGAVNEAANQLRLALVPHTTVIDRAMDAVSLIERQIEDARCRGDLKAWTAEYKASRAAKPELNYSAFMQSKKLAMVAAAAKAVNR